MSPLGVRWPGLRSENKFSSYQLPVSNSPHFVTVKDKRRNSGLTSCRFLTDHKLVCCDFNEKTSYLVDIANNSLSIVARHPTILASGESVQTDLMDLRGNRFVVSNFYQGSVSLYRVSESVIEFVEEIDLAPDFKNMHGLRFIPGYEDLIWVTFCGTKNKCHQIWDIRSKKIIHHVSTDEQCQDVAFMGNFAVVFARTNHIWIDKQPDPRTGRLRMYATAYIYSMPANLYTSSPTLCGEWKGRGHLDAVKEYDGFLYGANQYLDRIDVFSLHNNRTLRLRKTIKPFAMPHGLDIYGGKLAVTNYVDSTLRVGIP